MLTKEQHLKGPGPKRILALDGGGLRGYLTLQYLQAIEDLLRRRSPTPDTFRLCDYFDLIGGTSTGSIIAAALACGYSVGDLEKLYKNLGDAVFNPGALEREYFVPGVLAPKFDSNRVQKALDDNLGADVTLDSNRIRTGLMVMVKRLDTGSPWPLHNHPDAAYAAQDGKLFLTHVVRASTAAPTYFKPEVLDISARDGTATKGAFVDGGVSPHNDPTLQMLMVAALHGHGFRWPTGPDNLLIISVGTGFFRKTAPADKIAGMVAAKEGLLALAALMDDCARTNHALMQWLTLNMTPWEIDRALGDMQLDSQNGPKLARYARYNVLLDSTWLRNNLQETRTTNELEMLAQMDKTENMNPLAELGRKAATKQVAEEHFPRSFDIWGTRHSTGRTGALPP
jgi:hypothetical protein